MNDAIMSSGENVIMGRGHAVVSLRMSILALTDGKGFGGEGHMQEW